MYFNQVTLIGRITADPIIKYVDNDKKVVQFNIAVNRGYKDSNDKHVTDFFNCIAWNKTAEIAAEYLSKGKLIFVIGQINNNTWVDSDNNTRRTVQINVETIRLLESRIRE